MDIVIKLILIGLCVVALPYGGWKPPVIWYVVMIIMNGLLMLGVATKVRKSDVNLRSFAIF